MLRIRICPGIARNVLIDEKMIDNQDFTKRFYHCPMELWGVLTVDLVSCTCMHLGCFLFYCFPTVYFPSSLHPPCFQRSIDMLQQALDNDVNFSWQDT